MPIAFNADQPIHWESTGTGPPLVLLHGLGGDVTFFDGDQPALSQDHRLVMIDLRGSGTTPASNGGHRIEDLADDVAAVLDDANIDRAHVLGFSMGGQVALSFAHRHSERLNRLVLAGACANLNSQTRMFVDAVLNVYETGASPRQMFNLVCPWLFSIDFLSNSRHAPYFAYPEDDPLEQSLADWRALYLAQRAFDARPLLPHISAPTLVVAGRHDRLASTADAELLAASIPNAHLHMIERAGHLVNVEATAEYSATVTNFLSTNSAREQ